MKLTAIHLLLIALSLAAAGCNAPDSGTAAPSRSDTPNSALPAEPEHGEDQADIADDAEFEELSQGTLDSLPPKKAPDPGSRGIGGDRAGADPALMDDKSKSDRGSEFAQAIAKLDSGLLLYNPPERMTLGTQVRIEVRVQQGMLPVAGLDERLSGEGVPRTEIIQVGTFMKVSLCCGAPGEGHPFEIVALNHAEQVVLPDTYTQWAFNVTPLEGGPQTLNLTVTVRIKMSNGQEEKIDYPVKEQQIQIEVDHWRQVQLWFMDNWQWCVSVLVLPLAVVLYTRGRRGKRVLSEDHAVFISYRREDSAGYSQALYATLSGSLGEDHVFMDVDDIRPGEDFVTAINTTLGQCDVLIAVIGQRWLSAATERGRRLDDPDDYVRQEIAMALQREIPLIPVLVGGATMPLSAELPDDIKALTVRNALVLRHDQYKAGTERLIEELEGILSKADG